MSVTILLDSGPLGLLTNPNLSQESLDCTVWLQSRLENGCKVFVPEVVDYEIRRELLRANKSIGLRTLDNLIAKLEYLPLSTSAMRQAAEFWAISRKQGRPTTNPTALDIDVILAAQAFALFDPQVIIATTNKKHLSQFVRAEAWSDITG